MSVPQPPSGSPYAAPVRPSPTGLPWYRVLVRLVLVLVLAQVLGAFVAGILVLPVDLRAHPAAAAALFWIVPGVLAGLALGLLLRPGSRLPWRLAGTAAAVGAATYLLLVLVSRARVQSTALPPLSLSLLGPLVGCVALQTVVALGVWLLRLRGAADR